MSLDVYTYEASGEPLMRSVNVALLVGGTVLVSAPTENFGNEWIARLVPKQPAPTVTQLVVSDQLNFYSPFSASPVNARQPGRVNATLHQLPRTPIRFPSDSPSGATNIGFTSAIGGVGNSSKVIIKQGESIAITRLRDQRIVVLPWEPIGPVELQRWMVDSPWSETEKLAVWELMQAYTHPVLAAGLGAEVRAKMGQKLVDLNLARPTGSQSLLSDVVSKLDLADLDI